MKTANLISEWKKVPCQIESVISGRTDKELGRLPGSEGLSLKELVHHITEANIVASTIIIAAIGASGSVFDWSWLWPNKQWCDRLAYSKVPTATSLDALKGLIAHITNIVNKSGREALDRKVRLLDSPGAKPYTKTVAEIIQMEIDHAAQHLADVKKIK